MVHRLVGEGLLSPNSEDDVARLTPAGRERLRFGARLGLVGVLAVLPLGAALAQEIPALVERGVDLVHPRALLVGVLGALAELVLLLHQGGDAAQDVLLVHDGPGARRRRRETDRGEPSGVSRRRAHSPRGTRPAAR
jgi:hypothetical protein